MCELSLGMYVCEYTCMCVQRHVDGKDEPLVSCLGAIHLFYYFETAIHYIPPTGLEFTESHLLLSPKCWD